jgi:hypothetical protein
MAQQKWNLGDIRPPERAARTTRKKAVDATNLGPRPSRIDVSESHEHTTRRESRSRSPRKGGGRTILLIAIIAVLGILIFLTTILLRGADITVYPKYRDVTVQATFTALQSPSAAELGYELLTLEEIGERTVAATGSEEAEERATGEITVYNAHSTDSQRLIKNTRFESPDGKIYRINDSIVVPGYTKDGSGKIVPGSTTVSVFADAPGEAYNIAPTRFTVPGLKGSDQFENIYAESKAPMNGGFIGTKLIVEESSLAQAQDAIRTELREKLLGRLQNERPSGFTLYSDAVKIGFESLPSIDAGANEATVREKAILTVPIFAEGPFAQYIAQNTITEYAGEAVRIEDPSKLAFAYTATSSPEAALRQDNRLEFSLAGNIRVIWDYDENQLREDVAGVAKSDLPSVLATYPAIERATTVIRPFWKRSFPETPQKIRIIESVGEGGE